MDAALLGELASWLVQTIIMETFLNPLGVFGLEIAEKEASRQVQCSATCCRADCRVRHRRLARTTKGATTAHHLGGGRDGGDENVIVVDEENMLTKEAC
jgi:hypothetical protein